jgi:signal transduction histidine kinase
MILGVWYGVGGLVWFWGFGMILGVCYGVWGLVWFWGFGMVLGVWYGFGCLVWFLGLWYGFGGLVRCWGFERNINCFSITSNNIRAPPEKDWYIHVVVLYIQTDLCYSLVDKGKKEHTCISTSCAKVPNTIPKHL